MRNDEQREPPSPNVGGDSISIGDVSMSSVVAASRDARATVHIHTIQAPPPPDTGEALA